MAAGDRTERTYGNWRKPVSPGIGRLGMLGTLILLSGLVATALAMMISLIAGTVVAVLVAVGLTPLLIQDRHGRTALQAAAIDG